MTKTDLDDNLLPILKRLINIAIIIIASIMVIEKLGYNISTLVAGVGLGGLAFALAAQDLIGNFFGGIAILTDKPFKVGDRVRVGTSVDGFVREIGLRTTRVETRGGTILVVPNRQIVDSILENVTHEKERRMDMMLGLEYGTSEKKLQEAKSIIIKNINKVDGLDHEKHTVTFAAFAASSLDIKVTYWINEKGLDTFDYWDLQDELLMGIKRDFEKAGISFAFPTQTLHIKK